MNKELENLEHIKDVLISMNFAFDDITANCFNNVENALTPPTEQELCEALGEYYHGNCEYKDNRFFIKYEGTICAKKENGEIILNFATTPKLGKMIFDFYEETKE